MRKNRKQKSKISNNWNSKLSKKDQNAIVGGGSGENNLALAA